MLFEVNPARGAKFVRTIRLPGQPARVCRFNPGEAIDLNREEQAFMRLEIENHVIGPVGKPFPEPPPKPRPKLDPSERDERDPVTLEFFDPIERHRRRWW